VWQPLGVQPLHKPRPDVAACGAYTVLSPDPLTSVALFECALSLVEYCAEQPVPPTVPLMSNCTPV